MHQQHNQDTADSGKGEPHAVEVAICVDHSVLYCEMVLMLAIYSVRSRFLVLGRSSMHENAHKAAQFCSDRTPHAIVLYTPSSQTQYAYEKMCRRENKTCEHAVLCVLTCTYRWTSKHTKSPVIKHTTATCKINKNPSDGDGVSAVNW